MKIVLVNVPLTINYRFLFNLVVRVKASQVQISVFDSGFNVNRGLNDMYLITISTLGKRLS